MWSSAYESKQYELLPIDEVQIPGDGISPCGIVVSNDFGIVSLPNARKLSLPNKLRMRWPVEHVDAPSLVASRYDIGNYRKRYFRRAR